MTLFPFADYWWFYLAFTAFVMMLLALDLGVFHRKAHAVSFREATAWSVVWIGLSLAFNYGFYRWVLWKFPHDPAIARQAGLEFLAGYVVEKALSLDNIFIFVVVFGFFAVPVVFQHRILFFGILGALVFRAIFIAAGSALLGYHWVIWIFGAFLILTGVKMAFVPDRKIEPEKNPVVKLFRRFVPVSAEPHGQRFFVKLKGVWHATPLFLALLFVELSDIIFAIDSVPAIFALTREPLIVFTSNVCAILGLRSLYFLLAGAADRFHLLKYAFAAILVFVGLKMVWLNDAFGGKFPISWSLAIIGGALAIAIALSLLRPSRSLEAPAVPS